MSQEKYEKQLSELSKKEKVVLTVIWHDTINTVTDVSPKTLDGWRWVRHPLLPTKHYVSKDAYGICRVLSHLISWRRDPSLYLPEKKKMYAPTVDRVCKDLIEKELLKGIGGCRSYFLTEAGINLAFYLNRESKTAETQMQLRELHPDIPKDFDCPVCHLTMDREHNTGDTENEIYICDRNGGCWAKLIVPRDVFTRSR